MFKNFLRFESKDSVKDNFMTVPVYTNKQELDKVLNEEKNYEYIVENQNEYKVDLSQLFKPSENKLPFFLSIKQKLESEFSVETTAA